MTALLFLEPRSRISGFGFLIGSRTIFRCGWCSFGPPVAVEPWVLQSLVGGRISLRPEEFLIRTKEKEGGPRVTELGVV